MGLAWQKFWKCLIWFCQCVIYILPDKKRIFFFKFSPSRPPCTWQQCRGWTLSRGPGLNISPGTTTATQKDHLTQFLKTWLSLWLSIAQDLPCTVYFQAVFPPTLLIGPCGLPQASLDYVRPLSLKGFGEWSSTDSVFSKNYAKAQPVLLWFSETPEAIWEHTPQRLHSLWKLCENRACFKE